MTPSGITIRSIAAGDGDAPHTLAQAYVPDWHERFRSVAATDPELALVAVDSAGRIVGVCFGTPSNSTEGELTLDGIAVEADCWQNGIGSALLAEFERRVRDRGYASIGLGSAGGYVDAFYAKNGYQRPDPSRRPKSFAKDLRT